MPDDQALKAKTFFDRSLSPLLNVVAMSEMAHQLASLRDMTVGIDGLSCSHLVQKTLTEQEGCKVKELSGAESPVSKLKIIKN